MNKDILHAALSKPPLPFEISCSRREMLVLGAGVPLCLLPCRSPALAPIMMLILPSAIASLIALWGAERQEERAERRHLQAMHETMRSNRANEWLSVVTLLNSVTEERRSSTLELMKMQLLVDRGSREVVNGAVLSENLDGFDTRFGVHSGHLAVERSGQGGWLCNETASDFARWRSKGDPVPVPTSKVRRDVSPRGAAGWQDTFARKSRLPIAEVERDWLIVGERDFSRARKPRGNPDITAAAFQRSSGHGGTQYVYRTA